MTKNELSHFHLERDGMKIKLKKGVDADSVMDQLNALRSQAPASVVPSLPATSVTAPGAPPPATQEAVAASDGEGPAPGEVEITSPMVGTFFSAGSPDSPPFVDKGSEVNEDTVICIVEAMKVMNEIKAEQKGTVTRVIAENGTPVQYGEPLFYLRPS